MNAYGPNPLTRSAYTGRAPRTLASIGWTGDLIPSVSLPVAQRESVIAVLARAARRAAEDLRRLVIIIAGH